MVREMTAYAATAGMVDSIAGLLEKIINEAGAERRRKHEERMKLIQLISDSKLRDAYAQQLLLNQFFLDASENAQQKIQNTAKHSQWLAEAIGRYYEDHGATQEQAKGISMGLRLLAVKISKLSGLDDLLVMYEVATLFTNELSQFRHRNRKYSIERSMRHGILEPLNDCIAIETNLRRRAALTMLGKDANLDFWDLE